MWKAEIQSHHGGHDRVFDVFPPRGLERNDGGAHLGVVQAGAATDVGGCGDGWHSAAG
jgi:hypothetical protein